jgi:FkbH-like protein
VSLVIISDFTATNLATTLQHVADLPAVDAVIAPSGQPTQVLLDDDSMAWSGDRDAALIWVRPEGISSALSAAQSGTALDRDLLRAEVTTFANAIKRAAKRLRYCFLATLTVPWYQRAPAQSVAQSDGGIGRAVSLANECLITELAGTPNLWILDAQRWLDRSQAGYDDQLWYLAKVPFAAAVFRAAATDVQSLLRGLLGQSRKLIILDLDDTLWGGTVGDAGWENLRLGGHDAEGEALLDFQRGLKALEQRGVMLGIVSKNEETIAREAIQRQPSMILREADFVGWRINWQDKAQNVKELTQELNIGLQSVVFIDDSPAERARVREAFPDVLVPEWPENKMLYPRALMSLGCFEMGMQSAEDASRTRMYIEERQREEVKTSAASMGDWLASLQLRVTAELYSRANAQRTVQLLNKTNQMNLRTRRMSESELASWVAESGHELWVFSVSDRFGSYGLTGIAGIAVEDQRAEITDFILSCRVMGRQIEETMLYVLIVRARALGVRTIGATYEPTVKNAPCISFFQQSGWHTSGEDGSCFSWVTADQYELPSHVDMELLDAAVGAQ